MNVYIMNGDRKISQVLTRAEAEERLQSGLLMFYPNATIVPTDEEIAEKIVINVVPEEIEETGCAGGGCSL